jgi:hypothetical protein
MTTKREEEEKAFKAAGGSLLGFLAYIVRYRFIQVTILVSVLVSAYIIASNISYTQARGLEWVPSISTKVEIKK